MKTPMPANVRRGMGYISYIKSFRASVFAEDEVQKILAQIQSGHLEPSRATIRRHVEQLQARADVGVERKCPKCGSAMVLRSAKRDSHAGNPFWGCSLTQGVGRYKTLLKS